MQQQRAVQPAADLPPPWSPLSVAIICLLFPPGGAIVTIRNLQRLKQMDARPARTVTLAVLAIFALGYAVLLALANPQADPRRQVDSGAATVLQIGVALVSYGVQRAPFRLWRISHLGTKTSSWTSEIGVALLYTAIWLALTLPLYILLASVPHPTGVEQFGGMQA